MKYKFSVSQMKEYLKGLGTSPKVGTTIHMNHPECPAGEDVKRRLYLTQKATGTLMYCHHCQGSGFLRTDEKIVAVGGLLHEEKEIVTEEVVSKIIARYYEYRDFDSWPLELRLWWWSFDLDHVDATNLHCKINRLPDQLGLAFSPAYGLYQIRRFGEGPKTYIQPELLTASPTVFHGAGRPYILVFTEDALSAYKVAKHGGVTTLPLYGTRSVTSEMKLIASRATKVYGWFDPDWAGDKCGLDLVRQVPGAELIHTAKQPKSVSILEIKDVVKGL